MRLAIVACLFVAVLALGLTGCRTAPGALQGPSVAAAPAPQPGFAPEARTEWVRVNDVPMAPAAQATPGPCQTGPCQAPAPARTYWRQDCRPRCWSGCGLPCEEGFPNWHARAVLGIAFMAGDDAANECVYYGADLGWTSPCCWGVDVFYRTHQADFDRDFLFGTAAPVTGTDGGRFHHVGVKLTYERSFCKTPFFGYAGIGPQYFWTDDYLNNDSGVGGFAELGVGYVFNKCWRVRAGVEILAQDSTVTRRSPVNDGQSRLLWVVAPVIQVEGDL